MEVISPLDINEVAEILKVHPGTVRRLMKKEVIPAIKVGAKYRTPVKVLDIYINIGPVLFRF